jgi:hypothetical protein
VPLTFHATDLPTGHHRRIRQVPPEAMPGALGQALVGLAPFVDTVLASIAWEALREGLFTGLCPILLEPETLDAEQVIVGGQLLYVTFGDRDGMCNPNSGVMGCWEELLDGCWMTPARRRRTKAPRSVISRAL